MMLLFLYDRRYKAKSLDHEIYVTMTYKKYEVIRSMKLNKYPKYDAYLLDRARDIRQNYWTMSYRSRPNVRQALRLHDLEVRV